MSQPGSPSPLARRASWLGALAVTAILTLACEDSAGPLPTPAAPTSPPASSFYNPRPERTDYVVGMVDRLPDAGGVTWTSSNPDVLAVLPGGRFLARGAGQADLIGSGASQETRVTLSVTLTLRPDRRAPADRPGDRGPCRLPPPARASRRRRGSGGRLRRLRPGGLPGSRRHPRVTGSGCPDGRKGRNDPRQCRRGGDDHRVLRGAPGGPTDPRADLGRVKRELLGRRG